MGLYLCIFNKEEELEGVEVGSYSDFEYFRANVTQYLESGSPGSRFPTLILHSDCDGEWVTTECALLKVELELIAAAFRAFPPIPLRSGWQELVAKSIGLRPSTLYESFIDVDGELLLERLIRLCEVAIDTKLSILFQ